MTHAVAEAVQAEAKPFDAQIRAIIPTLVPWLADANIWNHSVKREYKLDAAGYWAEEYGSPHVMEREGVKELIGFLELSVGGTAKWKDFPSQSTPSCEVMRPDYHGPRWWLTFWDLEGPAKYMQAYAHHTPKIEISYWVRS